MAAAIAVGLASAATTCGAPTRPPPDAGVFWLDGGSDAGLPTGLPGSDAGLPLTGACAVLNARRCEYLQRCGLIDSDVAALRNCLAYFSATWCGPSKWPALVEASTLRYEPVVAQACAEGFASRACADWETEPLSCLRFLSPNRYLGQPCYGSEPECRSGVCRGFSCPRSCSLVGQLNEACSKDPDCQVDAGLYCQRFATATVGRCTALGRVGSTCDVDGRCSPELFCTSQSPSTCEARRISMEGCYSTADCVADDWCHITATDGGLCIPRSGMDAGCTDDDQCREGLLCQTLERRCEPLGPLPEGSPCSLRQTCAEGVCVGATPQSLGSCHAPRFSGQECVSSGDCEPHLACASSDGGAKVCGPRLPAGSPCALTRDCLVFAQCAAGSCVDLPGPGQVCLRQSCLYGACLSQPDGGNICVGQGAPGSPCLSDAECGSGECVGGQCLSSCSP